MKEEEIMTGKELLELAKEELLGINPLVQMHNTDKLRNGWINSIEELEENIELDKLYKVITDEYHNTEDYWVIGGVIEITYHFTEIE